MSPYLTENRLADVIAAIQATGTYKFYWQSFEEWAYRICGDKAKAPYWQAIFEQHPEFFRLDGERTGAALVWRRQNPKRYDVDADRTLTKQELAALPAARRETRISRAPLTPEDIHALISTAIDLHARVLDRERDRRWWIPAAAAFIGSLVGAFATFGAAWVKALVGG